VSVFEQERHFGTFGSRTVQAVAEELLEEGVFVPVDESAEVDLPAAAEGAAAVEPAEAVEAVEEVSVDAAPVVLGAGTGMVWEERLREACARLQEQPVSSTSSALDVFLDLLSEHALSGSSKYSTGRHLRSWYRHADGGAALPGAGLSLGSVFATARSAVVPVQAETGRVPTCTHCGAAAFGDIAADEVCLNCGLDAVFALARGGTGARVPQQIGVITGDVRFQLWLLLRQPAIASALFSVQPRGDGLLAELQDGSGWRLASLQVVQQVAAPGQAFGQRLSASSLGGGCGGGGGKRTLHLRLRLWRHHCGQATRLEQLGRRDYFVKLSLVQPAGFEVLISRRKRPQGSLQALRCLRRHSDATQGGCAAQRDPGQKNWMERAGAWAKKKGPARGARARARQVGARSQTWQIFCRL